MREKLFDGFVGLAEFLVDIGIAQGGSNVIFSVCVAAISQIGISGVGKSQIIQGRVILPQFIVAVADLKGGPMPIIGVWIRHDATT